MNGEREPYDLSMIPGGPLYRFYVRTHITGTALDLVHRRVVVLTAFAWLPLLVLALLDHRADAARIPFLKDIATQARMLVALPLLIIAEKVVHRRTRLIVRQFIERGLIADESRPGLDAAITGAMGIRDSVMIELLLLVLVYITTFDAARTGVPNTGGWTNISPGSTSLTWPGIWYIAVSAPMLRFLLVRWYLRLLNWALFLFRVSRLKLVLEPLHPDRCGGIGFLLAMPQAFVLLVAAHGVLLSGAMANGIFFDGRRLPSYGGVLIAVTITMIVVVTGPLISFVPTLARARRSGLYDFGMLGVRYARAFSTRFFGNASPPATELLGAAEIQSLADLGNSFDIVQNMRIWPVSRRTVLQLTLATLAPVAPLALTMLSMRDVLNHLVKLVF